ncbi:MAG: glycosyltransferase family 39 protein [Cyanobacteriota bacterium]|nr:glycosyltransferase family 39 protein [Cyanobacteriota bacterium]
MRTSWLPRLLPPLVLVALWGLATAADRLWLHLDAGLPAWDQADYLNSAVDHGRALGLLPGGGWAGWRELLDLSPKIPPLASLVNGSVIALAGDSPDQASWALALWHGLLLLAVAAWGRDLQGPVLGLLAALLVALMPALAALRVDFTLDLPLTATTTLALWLLGRWQAPAPRGGHWGQLLPAAAAVAAALLVKQSALLVLLAPGLWALGQALAGRRRRQGLVGMAIVLAALTPWLQHNWITTLGGTNRAVLQAAAAEGDPPPLGLASLLWYPLRLPDQLGLPLLLGALAGAMVQRRWWPRTGTGWPWLIGTAVATWLLTSLSPNKDDRYIAPLLPLLALLLAGGWWRLAGALGRRLGRAPSLALLGTSLAAAALLSGHRRAGALTGPAPRPTPQVCDQLRAIVADQPATLLVLPSSADLNQHTITSFCRQGSGQAVGRQPLVGPAEATRIGLRSHWLLLATGNQGTDREGADRLSRQLRADPRFGVIARWPWSEGRQLELLQRRPQAPAALPFDQGFIQLARGLERGPRGLAAVFDQIGPEHQLDGDLSYQVRVEQWAQQRLIQQGDNRNALWSLALLATLRNRPGDAAHWYGQLERLEPTNPWPAAYRSVVLLAGWNPWAAAAVAEAGLRRQPNAVLEGLADLSGALGGNLRRLTRLPTSLPAAVKAVEGALLN